MEKKLAIFLNYILQAIEKIEDDLKKTENEWKERKGVFQKEGYVYKSAWWK